MGSKINNRIKHFRKSVLKLTLKEFSKSLEFSIVYISDIERGEKNPSFNFLQKLFSAFHISIDWLLSGEGEIFFSVKDAGDGETFQKDIREKENNFQATEDRVKEYPEITDDNIHRTDWFKKLSREQQDIIFATAELKDKEFLHRLKEYLLFQAEMERKQR